MIRLLVISDYVHTVPARPEAEILLQLQNTGRYQITVMTYAHADYARRFSEAGMRVIDFHPDRKFRLSYVRFIRKELKQGKYHVLQLFNNKSIINGTLAAIGIPVKVVVYRGYTGNIHWWDPFMYLKYLSPRVDRIICLVDAIKDIMRRNLLFGKDKAVTILKGHDLSWYEGVSTVPRSSLGVPDDGFVFICGANIRRMKGIKYLLRATYLLPADAKIYLVFAGKNMDKPEFRKLIENSPMRERIIQLGYRDDILEVVTAADVFVLASVKGEAITKAVIEAMSLEVCPLITDIPGNRGLVLDNICGLVVPPKDPAALADKMLWLSRHPERTREMGKAARLHIAQNLNTQETARRYDALYQELVNELEATKR